MKKRSMKKRWNMCQAFLLAVILTFSGVSFMPTQVQAESSTEEFSTKSRINTWDFNDAEQSSSAFSLYERNTDENKKFTISDGYLYAATADATNFRKAVLNTEYEIDAVSVDVHPVDGVYYGGIMLGVTEPVANGKNGNPAIMIGVKDAEIGDSSYWLEVYNPAGQGYASGSSWSRGQAWAIYGFAQSYLYTGNSEYLETAKRVAHYFIANLSQDGVPVVDFRAPESPVLKDTTAGAVAACGLIEIMKHVGEYEKSLYESAIEKLLQGLEKNCDFTLNKQSILQNGSERYSIQEGDNRVHISIIYGDYYLMDALLKLKSEGR